MLMPSTFTYGLAVVLPCIAAFVLMLALTRLLSPAEFDCCALAALIRETGADWLGLALLHLAGAVSLTTRCLVSSRLLRPPLDLSRSMTSFRARTS
jgi:hypothetical protein